MMSQGLIEDIRLRFATIPPGRLAESSDLTAVGEASAAAEAFLNKAAESPRINAALQGIVILASRLILDESGDNETERSLLIECVVGLSLLEGDDPATAGESLAELTERLAAHADDCIPELAQILSACPAAAADFFPIEAMGITERDMASHPIDPDRVIITSDEDRLVYTEFVSESSDHMDAIEEAVLRLEQDPGNIELLNRVFRCFHSIKGAAGFLGLCTTNLLCHDLESMLDRARKQTLTIDRVVADLILNACDILKKLLANIRTQVESGVSSDGLPPAADIRPIKTAIKKLLTREPPALAPGEEQPDVTRLGGKLVQMGVITEDILSKALKEQKRPLGKILVDMGEATSEVVEEVSSSLPTTKKHVDAIRVDTKKLDEMLAQVGELVVSQAIVSTDPLLCQPGAEALMRNVSNLLKITRSLQDMVMGLRMLPLRQTFHKMFRLVRDTAAKTGKEAVLTLGGEDTEIDKTLIDEITDPLLHMMRNAVDHGIESPDERVRLGKPREGQIRLTAYHHGGNVVIELRDDGAGLHRDRILAKAIQMGLASESREYSDGEVFDFILAPGFSIREAATDISGRGVGMDVVRRNLDGVGGRLEIRSTPGQGSTFTIRLPITMAIVDGMIVRVGDQKYVIPTLSIEESLQAEKGMFSSVSGRGRVIMLRDEVIKVASLAEMLGTGGAGGSSDRLILIVSTEEDKLGLVVDEILGQQQVVIKSMGTSLQALRGVAGGCILGDGRVALILDIASLLERADATARA